MDNYSILMDIKDLLTLEKPTPMKGYAKNRNKNKRYHYHEDVDHNTTDYFSLKRELDRLADKGAMKSYVMSKVASKSNPGKLSKKNPQPAISSETEEEPIYTIAGGFAGGGPTIRGNKDHLRKMVHSINEGQAASTSAFPNVNITEQDRGSSSDIISYKCLSKLKYRPDSMTDVSHPLVGFGGGVVHLVGRIDLPIRLGEKGSSWHMTIWFLVVEELTAYNLILGRPTINECKAVIIPALMLVKYERGNGTVGSLNED
ncbi:uncharacterized protein LOC110694006 [Chenopodium quinoa]|uniref:uncharacterized protein LOC110694006 n=1 Tax=Chenopodium quinoa TaxID=63459 RepID=UPI000B7876F5|nr:uncharacterized protein LOC110694006 [Chenopodium quinoa]